MTILRPIFDKITWKILGLQLWSRPLESVVVTSIILIGSKYINHYCRTLFSDICNFSDDSTLI